MNVAVELVSESRLNIPRFAGVSKSITQQNHISGVDKKPKGSQFANDLAILQDFAGNEVDLSSSVCHLGFLFAGWPHDISEIIEYTRGLPHMDTSFVPDQGRCCIISGSLYQWRNIVNEGCSAHKLSTAREAFNKVYQIICQLGLKNMFSDMKIVPYKDKTFLLEKK